MDGLGGRDGWRILGSLVFGFLGLGGLGGWVVGWFSGWVCWAGFLGRFVGWVLLGGFVGVGRFVFFVVLVSPPWLNWL